MASLIGTSKFTLSGMNASNIRNKIKRSEVFQKQRVSRLKDKAERRKKRKREEEETGEIQPRQVRSSRCVRRMLSKCCVSHMRPRVDFAFVITDSTDAREYARV